MFPLVFVRILNQMRLGILSDEAISTFRKLSRVPELHSNIQPTELYPLRKDVDSSNNARLMALPGIAKSFVAHDTGDPKRTDYFLAPGEIKLKINAQVMLSLIPEWTSGLTKKS
ncbi:hypothetical protein BX666DRAFT_1927872 [Dichotomocladium elegans]|nr:hypothetical protein BX666DRAFT_1927872 [Dichotomocladium elegans]